MTGDKARDILQLVQNVKFSLGSLICKEGDCVITSLSFVSES